MRSKYTDRGISNCGIFIKKSVSCDTLIRKIKTLCLVSILLSHYLYSEILL